MKPALSSLLGRRSFFRSAGMAAAGASVLSLTTESDAEAVLQNVNTRSRPSELKITDLRVAVLGEAPMTDPIIRIDTNQGISGYGEVRDGASKTYALVLKSRLLGENPCNVDRVFRKIKQFGGHARQGGGVCAVEMACWDLAGKAYGVPVYQMLGGRFRDRVRIYADTPEVPRTGDVMRDAERQAEKLKERMSRGLTFLKCDVGIDVVEKVPGTLSIPLGQTAEERAMTMHPFTGIELTEKGASLMADYVGRMREIIGMDIPLATDHLGHIGVNSCIRLAKAMEKNNLAWMEDMVPWQLPNLLKMIKDAVDVPILTGEDIYLKEDFIKLIEYGAVDMIHPDLATAGGILEVKKIGDYAMERGVPMAMHFAGSPISFMANVHCAAATENFVALEHHSLDVPWWGELVTPAVTLDKGFAVVPDRPGLGVEPVESAFRKHLRDGGYFEPTPEWDKERSWDRLWS
ncbi:MAG TPA: mandelate racemase/muconate lactonizing enzyme family protein [Vicinamibacteria bacterium]|nr:mandelate racemase/muconate lactonizing enzyme family protein [Vicinamibacteria bacterium]